MHVKQRRLEYLSSCLSLALGQNNPLTIGLSSAVYPLALLKLVINSLFSFSVAIHTSQQLDSFDSGREHESEFPVLVFLGSGWKLLQLDLQQSIHT